jgi:hypothetical protein
MKFTRSRESRAVGLDSPAAVKMCKAELRLHSRYGPLDRSTTSTCWAATPSSCPTRSPAANSGRCATLKTSTTRAEMQYRFRCYRTPMHATATALVAGHNHPQVLQVQRLPVYPDGKDHLFALELRRQLAQRQDGRVVCRSFSSGNIDTERLCERRIPRFATPVNIHIDSRSGLKPISRRSVIRRARTA